jgi:adenylate cyclase
MSIYSARLDSKQLTGHYREHSMPYIRVLPEDCTIEVQENESLLSAARRNRVQITSACGGNARCSTCRVNVESGLENCTWRNEKESAMADRLALTPTLRLGCQLHFHGNATVRRLARDDHDATAMQSAAESKLAMVGQERRVAIFFSDIRGFTSFSERLPPFDVIHVLNRYFNEMSRIVEVNGGSVNNYIGDGMMALFGIADPYDAPIRAVKAGLEMLSALQVLNTYLQRLFGLDLNIGIGIHWGDAVVGSLGAGSNRRTTAIGDAVNLASRIESANKLTGTRLLISEATYSEIKSKVITGRQVNSSLKGKSGSHTLYEITGIL